MKINERGYWENDTTEGHGHDEGLAKALAVFFKNNKARDIIDIGCGDGYYTKYLLNNNIKCDGYDGNPNTELITDGLCCMFDFTYPMAIAPYDWTLSLEVGEHIPKNFEDMFIKNLVDTNIYGAVVSWSIPEYGGDGHVNPRSNEYITNKFFDLGMYLDIESMDILRNSVAKYPTPCYWFSRTLFVFRK
jgi:hypothetical protein